MTETAEMRRIVNEGTFGEIVEEPSRYGQRYGLADYTSTYRHGSDTEGVQTRSWAQKMDGHFLLMYRLGSDGESLFGIVDCDDPDEANRRLYHAVGDFIQYAEDITDTTRFAETSEAVENRTH